MPLIILGALALAIGVVVFALNNNDPVVVSFMVWEFEGSLALILLLTLALGVLLGILVCLPTILRKRSQLPLEDPEEESSTKETSSSEAKEQDHE